MSMISPHLPCTPRSIFALAFHVYLSAFSGTSASHATARSQSCRHRSRPIQAGQWTGQGEASGGIFYPRVPPGFRLNVFAANFKRPRWLTVAPNGDIFLADTGAGEIVVPARSAAYGAVRRSGKFFADGMKRPFGIAFREDYVYCRKT